MRVDVSGSEPWLVPVGPELVGNRLLFESVSRDQKLVDKNGPNGPLAPKRKNNLTR
jgi:hypothetical protein